MLNGSLLSDLLKVYKDHDLFLLSPSILWHKICIIIFKIMLQDYNSESTNASEATNVIVQIQLIDYIDQGLRLPNGQTCVCPNEFSCSYLGASVPRCYMSFTVILLSPEWAFANYLLLFQVNTEIRLSLDIGNLVQNCKLAPFSPFDLEMHFIFYAATLPKKKRYSNIIIKKIIFQWVGEILLNWIYAVNAFWKHRFRQFVAAANASLATAPYIPSYFETGYKFHKKLKYFKCLDIIN